MKKKGSEMMRAVPWLFIYLFVEHRETGCFEICPRIRKEKNKSTLIRKAGYFSKQTAATRNSALSEPFKSMFMAGLSKVNTDKNKNHNGVYITLYKISHYVAV